jgi:ketosteroid isomerase-like protein
MSTNMQLVREIYDRWERGDWQGYEWADPEIEFVIADGPDPRRIVGRDAMNREWRDFLGAWTDYSIEGEEFRELDGDRVLVLLHAKGHGKSSGAAIAPMVGANIFTIRAGRVARLAIYFDHRSALSELASTS